MEVGRNTRFSPRRPR